MKVLLVGKGGREHALARALIRTCSSSNPVSLIVQAGNPGIDSLGTPVDFDETDSDRVAQLAVTHQVDLVVVGPERPLVAGVADAVRGVGIPCFGPSQTASRLESSKSFAKEVMVAAHVPTARSVTCETVYQVLDALEEFGAPYVVKDDGLAGGKGVVVTSDHAVAEAHARTCLEHEYGAVVIEEYLDGPEVSLFCLSDGYHVVPLVPAQDFKRLLDGNQGPNTGSMGAYTPLPWLPSDTVARVVAEVAQPTVEEMARRGTPFVGLLYCGLAMTSQGIRVVEFNARFGDPETQVVLERLDSPLAEALLAAATGTLADMPELEWSDDAAVTVVMASEGYPARSITGRAITGVDVADAIHGVHVIHAGTSLVDGVLTSSGGRVVDVTARAASVEEARSLAYQGVDVIHFDGEQHRHDIATWPAGQLAHGRN